MTTVLAAFITDPDICDGKPECALIAYWGPRARELFAAAVTRRKGQPPSSRRMAEGTCVGQPRPDRRRSAQRPGQGFTVPVPSTGHGETISLVGDESAFQGGLRWSSLRYEAR